MDRCSFARKVRERVLRLDGATGTELAKQGMPPGVCPEKWVTENPEALYAVQRAYVNAGSNIVYAPTFGANPFKLAEFGLEKNCREINAQLVKISRAAVEGKARVFGDMAPTGNLVEPFGELPFERCVDAYKEQVRGLLEGGVDGFVIETMLDLQECRAALLAVRELAPDHPVMVTMTFDESGKSLTGCDPVSALICLQALGADAFGCNCSVGPEAMAQVIGRMKPYARIPLIAKPHAGLPHLQGDKTVFDLGPAEFAAAAAGLIAAGAAIVGGCCGTTPEHIAALDKALGDKPGEIFEGLDGVANVYVVSGEKAAYKHHPSVSPWGGHYRPEMKMVCDGFTAGDEAEIWVFIRDAQRVHGVDWPVKWIYTTAEEADALDAQTKKEWDAANGI